MNYRKASGWQNSQEVRQVQSSFGLPNFQKLQPFRKDGEKLFQRRFNKAERELSQVLIVILPEELRDELVGRALQAQVRSPTIYLKVADIK